MRFANRAAEQSFYDLINRIRAIGGEPGGWTWDASAKPLEGYEAFPGEFVKGKDRWPVWLLVSGMYRVSHEAVKRFAERCPKVVL